MIYRKVADMVKRAYLAVLDYLTTDENGRFLHETRERIRVNDGFYKKHGITPERGRQSLDEFLKSLRLSENN